mgnify:FL=1
MTKAKEIILIGMMFTIFSAFANIRSIIRTYPTPISVISKGVVEHTLDIKSDLNIIKVDHLKNFLSSLGIRESSNRWNIVNQWGYYGRWQLSKANIKKFCGCTPNEFLKSPELQTSAMMGLLKHNKRVLRRQIKKYANTARNGVWVTESGMLASAHLAGAGNVRRWLRNGKDPKDKLGTSLTDYMTLFGGYNLQIPN